MQLSWRHPNPMSLSPPLSIYSNERVILPNVINGVDTSILEKNDMEITKMLLYGKRSNTYILKGTIDFSLKTKKLHNLHGHDVGFYYFIAFLNSSRLSSCFISWSKISQAFGPRNFIHFVPLKTICTNGIQKSACFLNWQGTSSWTWTVSFTIWGLMDLKNLNNSIARNLIFWWWIETMISFEKSLKISFLWLCTMCRHCLCRRLILFFKERLQHIQVMWQ